MAIQPRNGRVGPLNSDDGNPLIVGDLAYVPNQRAINHADTMNQVNHYSSVKKMMESNDSSMEGIPGPYSQTIG